MSFNDIINTLEGVVENEYTFDPMNGMIYDFTKKEDINAFLNGKKSVFVVGITKGVEDINLLESDYNKLIDSGKSPFIGKWGGVYDLVLTFDTDEEASKYDQNIILKIQGTEFVEQEHPRDSDGKFTTKGGGIYPKNKVDIDKLNTNSDFKQHIGRNGIIGNGDDVKPNEEYLQYNMNSNNGYPVDGYNLSTSFIIKKKNEYSDERDKDIGKEWRFYDDKGNHVTTRRYETMTVEEYDYDFLTSEKRKNDNGEFEEIEYTDEEHQTYMKEFLGYRKNYDNDEKKTWDKNQKSREKIPPVKNMYYFKKDLESKKTDLVKQYKEDFNNKDFNKQLYEINKKLDDIEVDPKYDDISPIYIYNINRIKIMVYNEYRNKGEPYGKIIPKDKFNEFTSSLNPIEKSRLDKYERIKNKIQNDIKNGIIKTISIKNDLSDETIISYNDNQIRNNIDVMRQNLQYETFKLDQSDASMILRTDENKYEHESSVRDIVYSIKEKYGMNKYTEDYYQQKIDNYEDEKERSKAIIDLFNYEKQFKMNIREKKFIESIEKYQNINNMYQNEKQYKKQNLETVKSRIGNEIVTPLVEKNIHLYSIGKINDETLNYTYNKAKETYSKNSWIRTSIVKRSSVNIPKSQSIPMSVSHEDLENRMHIQLVVGEGKTFKSGGKTFKSGGSWNSVISSIMAYEASPQIVDWVWDHELSHSTYDQIIQAVDGGSLKNKKNALDIWKSQVLKLDPKIIEHILGKYTTTYLKDHLQEPKWVNRKSMLETEIFAGITDLKNGKDLGTHKNIITAYNELNKHYPELVKSYELLKGVEDYNIYGENITSITNIQEPNKIDYELVSYLDNNKNPVSKEQAVIIIIKGYTLNGRMISHESFFVDNKLKTVTQEAYDETKHRRGGNSQNTGQFSSGGSGGKLERKEKHKKPKFDLRPSLDPSPNKIQSRVKMINEIKKFFKNIDTSKLLAEAEKSDSEWSSREKLGLQIDDTLANTFQNTRVMHRTKDTFSSMEKLARKPEIYKSIDDLHDRTGVRAICHNLQEVKDMIKYVEENYDIIKENDYLEGHTDGSGYRSYHCIIKDHNTGFEAEIQIRTENEDIWANVFHDLYKPHEVKIKQALKTNPDGIRKYANDYSKYLYNIDCCNKYGILPTLPQELIIAGFGYSKEVKSNPDFFDHILGEIEEMTPDHGFNIVIFDDYATDGEKLSLVGNYDTEQDANEIKSQCEAQGKITYIYTTDSIQESFVEQEHPRDTDGQFTTKGGGQTNSNNHDESGNHNKSINDDDWKGFDDVFKKYPDIFKRGNPDISKYNQSMFINTVHEKEGFWKDIEWNKIDVKLDKLKENKPKKFIDLKYEESDKLYDIKNDTDNNVKADIIRDELRNIKYDNIRKIDEWKYISADKMLSKLEKEYEKTGDPYTKDKIDRYKAYLEYNKKDAEVERRVYNHESLKLKNMMEESKNSDEPRIIGINKITDKLIMSYHNFMVTKQELLDRVKYDYKIEKLNKKKWKKISNNGSDGNFDYQMTMAIYEMEYGNIIKMYNDYQNQLKKVGTRNEGEPTVEEIESLYNNIPKKVIDFMNVYENTSKEYNNSINLDSENIKNDIKYNIVTPLMIDGYGISAVKFERGNRYLVPTIESIKSTVEILTKRKNIDRWKDTTNQNLQVRLHAGKGNEFKVGKQTHHSGGHWNEFGNEITIYNTERLKKLDSILPHEFAHSQFTGIFKYIKRNISTLDSDLNKKLRSKENMKEIYDMFIDEVGKIKEGIKSNELSSSIKKIPDLEKELELESSVYDGGKPEKIFTSYFMDYIRARDDKNITDGIKSKNVDTEMFACLSELKYSDNPEDRKKLFMIKLAYPKLFKSYEIMEGGARGLPNDEITDKMNVGFTKVDNIREIMNSVESKGRSYKTTEYLNFNWELVDPENAEIVWIKEYDSNDKLIGMQSYSIDLKEVTAESYDETKHRRSDNS